MAARLLLPVVAIVVLAGCVHAYRVTGPDGQPDWWRISCPGGDDDVCYQKASELCPHDYRIAPIPESERRVDSECHRTAYEVEFNVSKSCTGTLVIKCQP